jgi:hypothetical protein
VGGRRRRRRSVDQGGRPPGRSWRWAATCGARGGPLAVEGSLAFPALPPWALSGQHAGVASGAAGGAGGAAGEGRRRARSTCRGSRSRPAWTWARWRRAGGGRRGRGRRAAAGGALAGPTPSAARWWWRSRSTARRRACCWSWAAPGRDGARRIQGAHVELPGPRGEGRAPTAEHGARRPRGRHVGRVARRRARAGRGVGRWAVDGDLRGDGVVRRCVPAASAPRPAAPTGRRSPRCGCARRSSTSTGRRRGWWPRSTATTARSGRRSSRCARTATRWWSRRRSWARRGDAAHRALTATDPAELERDAQARLAAGAGHGRQRGGARAPAGRRGAAAPARALDRAPADPRPRRGRARVGGGHARRAAGAAGAADAAGSGARGPGRRGRQPGR